MKYIVTGFLLTFGLWATFKAGQRDMELAAQSVKPKTQDQELVHVVDGRIYVAGQPVTPEEWREFLIWRAAQKKRDKNMPIGVIDINTATGQGFLFEWHPKAAK